MNRLNAWRKLWWDRLTATDEITWVSHWLLCMFATIIPAGLASLIFSPLVGSVTGFALSELLLLFMSGREVVDYMKHRQNNDEPGYVRDGIGDLVGPALCHFLWWVGLLFILFT